MKRKQLALFSAASSDNMPGFLNKKIYLVGFFCSPDCFENAITIRFIDNLDANGSALVLFSSYKHGFILTAGHPFLNTFSASLDDAILSKNAKIKECGSQEKVFTVKLNASTLEYNAPPPVHYPRWTELTCNQCPNCPLDAAVHKHCPVAVNAMELVAFFKEITSIEEVYLLIETDQRNYSKDTDMQTAASSLLGIVMSTSPCPILSQLKPMARFHLPFASLEETRYRAISMYLLGQFFLLKQGKKPDWELSELNKLYMNIDTVNRAFINVSVPPTHLD
ncbi:MAG: hypothetical protein HQL20_09250 [Candidatus Omnitrophica bacterium]|nr:hypothetical protein [Candidatus Omnitrophota bacterium]